MFSPLVHHSNNVLSSPLVYNPDNVLYTATLPTGRRISNFFREYFPGFACINKFIGRNFGACPGAFGDTDQVINSLPNGFNGERGVISVEGRHVDVLVLTNPESVEGRWGIYAPGNAENLPVHPETGAFINEPFNTFLTESKANWVFFSYRGQTTTWRMLDACRATVDYVIHQKQANQFIGYGYSLGGGILRETLQHYPLPQNVKTFYVWLSTFSNTASLVFILVKSVVTKSKFGKCLAIVAASIAWLGAHLFGWNIGSLACSRQKTGNHEVIIHGTNDKMIPTEASLGHALGVDCWRFTVESEDDVAHPMGDHCCTPDLEVVVEEIPKHLT